ASGHGITPDAIAVIYHELRNQPGFWPRIARIETKTEARFVQISEIRGRKSWADSCHELHELTRKGPGIRED
ncbi:MAG: hypothetical protein WBD79_12755, partial [Anaerolineae bacterium]